MASRRSSRAAGSSPSAEQAKRPWWTSGAVTALAGVVVASVLSTGGTWLLQSQQNHREDRDGAARAQAAARLLYAEVASSSEAIEAFANDRFLRPVDSSMTIDVSAEDQRLIAEHVTGEEWGDVANGLAGVQGLSGMVASLIAQRHTKLTPEQQCLARFDIYNLYFTQSAISGLMGATNHPPPPDKPGCNPGPGRLISVP